MFSLKKINSSDLFVALWGVYYLQGLIYPQGIINQLAQFSMILLGLSAFYSCVTSYKNPPIIKATILLILMYILYGLIIIMFGDNISWTNDSYYLKNSLNSLLPILFFFRQASIGNISEGRIKLYIPFILLIVIAHYTYFGQVMVNKLGNENITNNIGYMFVPLIPLIYFYYNRTIFQYVLLALIMLFIVLGMKRGAIIIGVVTVLIFLYSGFKAKANSKKIATILLSLITVVGFIYYFEYMMSTNDFFMRRIENTIEGNTSGRDYIYSSVWYGIISERNLLLFLFGHGANSSIEYAGNFAHQDWLETMCNNGLFGVIILSYFFGMFLYTVIKSKKTLSDNYFYAFMTLLFISFSKTLFSMSVQNFDMCQGMLIGYFTYLTFKSRNVVNSL